ncbi:unnamed protein product, partial [Rotaria sp. Silwood1]
MSERIKMMKNPVNQNHPQDYEKKA